MKLRYIFLPIGIMVLIVVIVMGVNIIMNDIEITKKYTPLLNPRIVELKDQKMIVVETGNVFVKQKDKSFGKLFDVYFQLKKNDTDVKYVAPRARWVQNYLDLNKDEIRGILGYPVSDETKTLPEQKDDGKIQLVVWQYGTVAEILNMGAFEKLKDTDTKLRNFIKENGYEIIGDHEEEYIKGPGTMPTDPKNFLTLIRYRIQKIK
jgi:effector-binding domain-containing protein